MINNRGIGIAKSWIDGKQHSYVKIISNGESGDFKIEFQNEKFETLTVKLDPKELIKKADLSKFMGV